MIADVHPPLSAVRDAVTRALAEDLEPLGDISGSLLGINLYSTGRILARDEGVVAGRLCVIEAFAQVDADVRIDFAVDDGTDVEVNELIATVTGSLPSVLAAERTALNFLGHLSGVATATRRYARASRNKVRILDTRKTIPGLRALEKAAVRAGGGFNHRGSLSDGIMLKDNHLAMLGIEEGVRRARLRWPGRPVHVECETIDQVEVAVAAGADRVMLDNMTPETVAQCVARVAGKVEVEVTGGVNIRNIGEYVEAGPDFISIGAITHSAPVFDVSLEIDRDGVIADPIS